MKKIVFLCAFFMTVEINADDIKFVCTDRNGKDDSLLYFVINPVDKSVLEKYSKPSLIDKLNPEGDTIRTIEEYHDVLSWEYPIVITKLDWELSRLVHVFDLEKGVLAELKYYKMDDSLPGYYSSISNCLTV